MKLNIGMLFAFAATTSQLAAAAPVAWNGKNAEAAYKTCSVAGAAAYMACRNTGHPIAGNVAAGGAVVAAGAEAAVKWSQSPLGKAAGQKVSAGAKAAKCAAGKVCNYAGKVIGNAASSVAKAGSSLVHGSHRQPQTDLEMGHHRRAQDDHEYSQLATREPEPEPEFEYLEAREPSPSDEAAPLYTRYAEPEPENNWDEVY